MEVHQARKGDIVSWTPSVLRVAIAVASVILAYTSLLKIYSALPIPPRSQHSDLSKRNPLFPFATERAVLVTASCFEIVVLAVVITARSYALKFLALLWLSAIFAVYRKLISQFNLQCNCAGVISPSSFLLRRAFTAYS